MEKNKEKLSTINYDWQIIEGKKLHKEFLFGTFMSAINFLNEIAIEALDQEYYPEIINNFNKVSINLWNEMIEGLTDRDFLLAKKIDDIYQEAITAESRAYLDALADIEKEIVEVEEEGE